MENSNSPKEEDLRAIHYHFGDLKAGKVVIQNIENNAVPMATPMMTPAGSLAATPAGSPVLNPAVSADKPAAAEAAKVLAENLVADAAELSGLSEEVLIDQEVE